MKSLFLLLFIVPPAVYCGPRIIGGRTVQISTVPYQLSFRRYGQHICGAAIISATVALTAAHCLPTPGAYSIKAGVSNLQEPGVVVHVREALVHPNYRTGSITDYDIAILYLSFALQFNASIQAVKLPETALKPGMVGVVSGWGVTSLNSQQPYSNQLRAVEVPVWAEDKCENSYFGGVSKRMFCAGLEQGGKDSCSGDSGGPFVVNGVLYGIVSAGMQCAEPGYPGIYTNIYAFRDFIRQNAGV